MKNEDEENGKRSEDEKEKAFLSSFQACRLSLSIVASPTASQPKERAQRQSG